MAGRSSKAASAPNNDGQDLICACDFAGFGPAGCAEGQVCVDITGANFCRY